jgi:hypothetical protein
MENPESLLGVGIYTVQEAAWMTNVSAPRIRRWMRGYKFRVGEETRASSAVWKPDLPEIGDRSHSASVILSKFGLLITS